MPTIKVPPVLRSKAGDKAEVSVDGSTVGEALSAFVEAYPGTKKQLFGPEGDLNRYVNVYLNDEDVRVLGGLETGASEADSIVILPAMAGGARVEKVAEVAGETEKRLLPGFACRPQLPALARFVRPMRIRALIPALLATGLLVFGAPAQAQKKAIWGPSDLSAGSPACPTVRCSAFPTYAALGVDTYQFQIHWDEVAPTRPANPRNPFDPAYRWPASFDVIVQQAAANGIGLAALIQQSPSWANGGQPPIWAPNSAADFADFAYAASVRYPGIRKWMIWGEPNRSDSFQPLAKKRRAGPRRYGRMLDAAYGALKAASRANIVIGGMTVNAGVVTPPQFINFMRFKGRMPRMDQWGHNPFDRRFPRLKNKPIKQYRGFNDIDTLWQEIQKAYKGKKGKKGKKSGRGKSRRPRALFLSEWTLPTDHPAPVFGGARFFMTRQEQARRITAAYRIARKTKYVSALGYFTLQDQPPGPSSNAWGLLDYAGYPKPGFNAYAAAP